MIIKTKLQLSSRILAKHTQDIVISTKNILYIVFLTQTLFLKNNFFFFF